MNGIPAGVNWDLLRDRLVEQVAVGRYQVSIGFDEGNISIEGAYEVITESKVHKGSAADPSTSAPLLQLLGLTVLSAMALSKATLEICFEGIRLHLHDNNESYESFRVVVSNINVVV